MKQEYKIKGIDKILEKVDKETLAKYYGVDINANFEEIITYSFKTTGIPNNSEIGLFVNITNEEFDKKIQEGEPIKQAKDIAKEFYEKDERKRAMYGINYNIGKGNFESVLYFLVDEPIKESIFENMRQYPQHYIGGYHYNGLLMGSKFYEEHEEELQKNSPKKDNIEAVDSYIENFINEFKDVEYTGGYGPRSKYEETDEIKKEKEKNEKIILRLTGKSSIDEISLQDFINLKRSLEQEEKDLKKEFEEKFTSKDYGEKD